MTTMNHSYKVVMVDPKTLKPHPQYTLYNPDPEEKVAQIAPSEVKQKRQEKGAGGSTWKSIYERVKASVEQYGIQEPLRVQETTQILLCGHKRCRIAIELGFETVPIIYEALDDEAGIDMMVADNFSRAFEETDPIKRARIYLRVKEMYGYSRGGNRRSNGRNVRLRKTDELAVMCRTTPRRFSDHIRLLQLIAPLRELVTQEVISVRGGSVLAMLPRDAQTQFARSMQGIEIDIPDRQIQVFRATWEGENPDRRAELDHLAQATDADDSENDDAWVGVFDPDEGGPLKQDFDDTGTEGGESQDRAWSLAMSPPTDESSEDAGRVERIDIRRRDESPPGVQSIEEQRHELVDRMGNTFSEKGKRNLEWMAFKRMMQSQIHTIRRWKKDFHASITPEIVEKCRLFGDSETELFRFTREIEQFLAMIRQVLPDVDSYRDVDFSKLEEGESDDGGLLQGSANC